jgi:hypothetical protein
MTSAIVGKVGSQYSSSMSLIQQRIAIDRERVSGVLITAFSGAGIIVGLLLLLFQPFQPMTLISLALWLTVCGKGIHTLMQARRRRIAFEAANGLEAGKQKPIT